MKNALMIYQANMVISVPRFALERAIKNLEWVEALALIRAAYQDEDGSFATLDDAKTIYEAITSKHPWEDLYSR